MIKNFQTCFNCKHENPLYSLTCNKCNAYLRTKIPNLDFWEITWKLFYEPTNTFIKIIQSEKKNYLALISFLFVIRFSVIDFIINNYKVHFFYKELKSYYDSLLTSLLILIITFIASYLITFLSNFLKTKTRVKDNFSIIIFSSIPNILAFIFLIPFQIALFGHYWFTVNPPPTIIKPLASYIFYIFELIFIAWNIILTFIAIKTQTNHIIYSLLITFLYYSLIFLIMFL